jgi:hypothetical protein
MDLVQTRGAQMVLPVEEDFEHLRTERAQVQFERWERGIHDLAATAFATALESGTSEFEVSGTGVTSPALARATVDVDVVEDQDPQGAIADIVVTVRPIDRSKPMALQHAEVVVLAAINPDEQAWDAAHVREASMYSFLGTLQDAVALATAAGARRPGQTHAGREAHRTHRERLTEMSVTGQATHALCGTWFVPRQDHLALPECPECSTVYALLQRLGPPPTG